MLVDSYIGLYLFAMENKIELSNYINIDIAYFQKKFYKSRPALRVSDEDINNDNDYNKVWIQFWKVLANHLFKFFLMQFLNTK